MRLPLHGGVRVMEELPDLAVAAVTRAAEVTRAVPCTHVCVCAGRARAHTHTHKRLIYFQ